VFHLTDGGILSIRVNLVASLIRARIMILMGLVHTSLGLAISAEVRRRQGVAMRNCAKQKILEVRGSFSSPDASGLAINSARNNQY
jgi:hypothetical protein